METALKTVKRYPEYIDSGLEWMGQIPKGWSIFRAKYIFEEINERSEDGTEELLSVSQYTGVTRKSSRLSEGDLLSNALSLEGYKKVCKDDLVSNIMLAWNGSLGFSPYNGIVSPAYSVYRPIKDSDFKYFHYLLRTIVYKSEFKRNSTGVIESRLRLYTDDFFTIPIIFPPLPDQTAIANFLDEKTENIDSAVSIKEKQIALLKERRQIIIQELVTGKKVWNEKKQAWEKPEKTIDSGVEWIGEIPEEWEVKRVKHSALKISKGTTPSTEGRSVLDEGDIRFIKAENIQDGQITIYPEHFIDKKTNEIICRSKLQENDILFVIAGATLGKVAIVAKNNLPANTNQAVSFIRPLKKANPIYLNIWLTSSFIKEIIWLQAVQSAQPNLSMEDLGNLPFISPPEKDQVVIVTHIESQSAKIDQAISIKEREIEKLKEYKASLVNDVVLGRVKVS